MYQKQLKKFPSRQKGYILLIVIIFLAILLAAGAHFFLRSTDHTKDSGGIRDLTESLLLAESAMHMGMGQFLSGPFDNAASNLPNNMSSQAGVAGIQAVIPSLYYITDTTTLAEIEFTSPRLLQIVADGEANNVANVALGSARLTMDPDTPLTRLRINDLFDPGANFRPLLFTLDPVTGLLTSSMAVSWDGLNATEKAAVWFEAIRVSDDAVNIYVQAVAEIDGAKSYVQRTLVGYDPSDFLGEDIAAISEASLPAEDVDGAIDRLRAEDK